MIVREAETPDREALIEMVGHFVQGTAYKGEMPMDRAHFERLTDAVLHKGIVFVAEGERGLVGMIGLLAYEHLGRNERIASEVVIWIEPFARGAGIMGDLMAAAESWVRRSGIRIFQVGGRADNLRLAKLYGRLGYRAVEVTYEKELR